MRGGGFQWSPPGRCSGNMRAPPARACERRSAGRRKMGRRYCRHKPSRRDSAAARTAVRGCRRSRISARAAERRRVATKPVSEVRRRPGSNVKQHPGLRRTSDTGLAGENRVVNVYLGRNEVNLIRHANHLHLSVTRGMGVVCRRRNLSGGPPRLACDARPTLAKRRTRGDRSRP